MQLAEPVVIVQGQVLNFVITKDFETKAPNGAKVRILAGEGGVEVKLTSEQLGKLAPLPGQHVAWNVRYTPWSMDGRSGLSCALVSVVDLGDVDALHSTVAASEPVKA